MVTSLAVSLTVGVAFLGCGGIGSLVAKGVCRSDRQRRRMAGGSLAFPWIPGPPTRRSGVLSMLHFGGLATLNRFLVFLAWNSDNILLGRFCGAHALGLYGRAYQLATWR